MKMDESNVPNLDCESHRNLMDFWMRHQKGREYKTLFPEGGKGTRRATADLASYASNKAAAITCRLKGDIQTALMYEKFCDNIFENLPKFALF